jgi:hypothetical protein
MVGLRPGVDLFVLLIGVVVEAALQVIELSVEFAFIRGGQFEAWHHMQDDVIGAPGVLERARASGLDRGDLGDVDKSVSGLQLGAKEQQSDPIGFLPDADSLPIYRP